MFFRKIFQLNKFEGADFKYDNSFFNLNPPPPTPPPKKKKKKKTKQIRYFWSQIYAFSFFHKILQLDKFEGADFKYNNISFKFQSKIPKLAIFCLKFKYFCFCTKTLQQDKFKDADFRYSNIVFKFRPKKTRIRHF